MKKLQNYRHGFSLLELMIVIAIIAFLSMIALPNLMHFLAKSKRTEAYTVLRSLYIAQKGYWLDHNKYTTSLTGNDSLNWKPSGTLHYTYGFPGTEGTNYVTGSLKTPGTALQAAQISDKGFTIAAVGDIDSDGKVDVITIDQDGNIKIIEDDLV